MIQALLDLLQLCLEFLVLYGQSPICVLQEGLEVLDTLVAGKQLALSDAGLFLQGRVLVDKLNGTNQTPSQLSRVIRHLPASGLE